MMIFFSLYFPILLSLSLSFFLHAFNKHIHSFFALISTFNTTTNYKLQKKCHHPISSTANVLPLPPPPPIGGGIGRLVMCTESLGFESFEIENDDGDDNNMIYNDSEGEVEEEGGGAAAEGREEAFPPPLSSLDGNGQPSFVLLPVRKDGRLQLSKVRVKRPEILRATRQDGRLRLYLVPDEECMVDDDMEQEDCEEEEPEEVGVETEEEETEEVVEMISRYCEEEEEEEDRVREREFPASGRGNEWFRGCHQVVHHIQCHQHVHSSHHHNHHLRMYGVGIA
ncbi:protein FANTASTIC FOUR 1-like [Lotus japonicus]|uniref:protein FANTASTIC FOUR 1-like n=1 Tax=Lotus japonicus TaxID=34305 RepID=UPI0025877395|nr:protein FANTASTIC FOUR 1-like [Lotus japonicus]